MIYLRSVPLFNAKEINWYRTGNYTSNIDKDINDKRNCNVYGDKYSKDDGDKNYNDNDDNTEGDNDDNNIDHHDLVLTLMVIITIISIVIISLMTTLIIMTTIIFLYNYKNIYNNANNDLTRKRIHSQAVHSLVSVNSTTSLHNQAISCPRTYSYGAYQHFINTEVLPGPRNTVDVKWLPSLTKST